MSSDHTKMSGPDFARGVSLSLIPDGRMLRGVGVVVEAVHLCMMIRGVEKQNSKTITSALLGQFRECPMTRDEFLRLAHQRV